MTAEAPIDPPLPQSSKLLTCTANFPPSTPTGMGMSIAWHCTFSPNGKILATSHGSPNPCIRLWEQRKIVSSLENDDDEDDDDDDDDVGDNFEWVPTQTLTGVHTRTVRCCSFSPDSKLLASASFDSTIGIWEPFDDDDNNGGTIHDGTTPINPSSSWDCTAQLEGHDNEVKCVDWNQSGTLLSSGGRDKTVWIWEYLAGEGEEFECLAVLQGHDADVKCVLFAENSRGVWGDGDDVLLSASYDDTIRCWAEDGGDWYCAAVLSGVHSSTVWGLAVDLGEGMRMVSASDDGSLGVWNCYTASQRRDLFPDEEGGRTSSDGLWKCVGHLPHAHSRSIYAVHCSSRRRRHPQQHHKWSSQPRIVSCGADNRLNVYREVTGEDGAAPSSSSDAPLFILEESVENAHDGDVNCVRWHPRDESVLASVGDDGCVKIWRYGGKV